MSVTIRGLGFLDANYYDGIVITQKEDDYIVNVRGKRSKTPMIKLPNKFSDRLKGLDDIDKIDNIIDYFLQYEKIISIRDDDYLSHYYGKYSSIKGSKDLSLQLIDTKMKKIFNKILKKYQMDRILFVYDNSNINNYVFNVSYKSSYRFSLEDWIEFDLKCNDGKLKGVEFEFFKSFIKEKLSEQNEVATIKKEEIFHIYGDNCIDMGYYIRCGDLSIKVDSGFLNEAQNIVDMYNNSREKEKIKQLKLEGF